MQTAVDCNGSSSNTTTISTTITTTTTIEHNDRESSTSSNRNDTTTMTQHHHQLHQLRQPALPPSPTTTTTETEPTVATPTATTTTTILRHRIVTNTNNPISTNYGSSIIAAPKNGLSHLIDAAEYLGSNVECMSATPSPSPQASPSKQGGKIKGEAPTVTLATVNTTSNAAPTAATTATISIPSPLQDTYKTNTSSDSSSSASKTASISTSTTSSVIATPILKRNGNVFKDNEEEEKQGGVGCVGGVVEEDNINNLKQAITGNNGELGDGNGGGQGRKKSNGEIIEGIAVFAEDACKQFRECTELLTTTTNQMLPNTSSTIIKKELSSSSLLPMSSSSTTSLLGIPTAASAASSSPPSSSSSSSSSSSTSVTPASATNTPALISTTPTPSSSPSASSSSSALSPVSAASPSSQSKLQGLSISGLVEAELLQWQDMPTYLQFNPYVLKGYRPLQTFKGCLLSLFYWHNETINILTHALPIVYILAIIPGLMPWDRGYRFLSFCHVFGSVAPWCGSFVYHLFMNIERGENVYYRLLKLDMVGIWVSQSFGALPLVTATTFCFTFKWKWFIIISYCLLSLWGLYKALTASSPWQRRLCFALPFTMRSILTFFRTIGLVGGNRVALEHVYLQDVVSILGGAIGAMRIPEKWFPGLVDFYLNSHNIMHVLVVVAVYSMHKATMKDFEWMDNANCDVFVNITSKVLENTLYTKTEL